MSPTGALVTLRRPVAAARRSNAVIDPKETGTVPLPVASEILLADIEAGIEEEDVADVPRRDVRRGRPPVVAVDSGCLDIDDPAVVLMLSDENDADGSFLARDLGMASGRTVGSWRDAVMRSGSEATDETRRAEEDAVGCFSVDDDGPGREEDEEDGGVVRVVDARFVSEFLGAVSVDEDEEEGVALRRVEAVSSTEC
ncbi:hypothetical protein HK101_000392 [Irineochytrium annulatum]|nr:hypothetical protein HK101_000392 [Irineochytrium annulatum]